jgi:hypothetical protein
LLVCVSLMGADFVFEIIGPSVELGVRDRAWIGGVPFSDSRDVGDVGVVVMSVCNDYGVED